MLSIRNFVYIGFIATFASSQLQAIVITKTIERVEIHLDGKDADKEDNELLSQLHAKTAKLGTTVGEINKLTHTLPDDSDTDIAAQLAAQKEEAAHNMQEISDLVDNVQTVVDFDDHGSDKK
jgi:ABC-type transporter Mla subunit MlaD